MTLEDGSTMSEEAGGRKHQEGHGPRGFGDLSKKTVEGTQRVMRGSVCAVEEMHVRIDSVDGHDAVCSMPFARKFSNTSGTLMGGIAYALGDYAGAVADVMPGLDDAHHTTVEGQMQYLAPGVGKRIVAKVHCEHFGRTTGQYTVQLYTDQGRHIASGHYTYLHTS